MLCNADNCVGIKLQTFEFVALRKPKEINWLHHFQSYKHKFKWLRCRKYESNVTPKK